MEEKYKDSHIYIYKEEKNKLLEELKNFKSNNETKIKLLHNLAYYDDMFEKFIIKINKGKIIYYIKIKLHKYRKQENLLEKVKTYENKIIVQDKESNKESEKNLKNNCIFESLNSKISHKLHKKPANNFNFVNALSNIL